MSRLVLVALVWALAGPARAELHAVRAGESWADLAEQHWGDRTVGTLLAGFAGADPGVPLIPGEKVDVPALVRWVAARGETFAGIARAEYGSTRLAGALAQLNAMSAEQTIPSGHGLRVPAGLFRDLADVGTGGDFESRLAGGERALARGEFEAALAAFERLRHSVLASAPPVAQARLLRHLVTVNVALDRTEGACVAGAALRALGIPFAGSGQRPSPRVTRELERCGGAKSD